MSKITVYGRRGWGSAIVEAQLEWLGLDYTYKAVGDLLRSVADMTGRDDLVPPPGSAKRPDFLRWLIFLVANVYPTYTYADEPDRFVSDAAARGGFRATVDAYAQRLYAILDATARTPWFLGDRFSALDIYVAVMTRWRPGRQWFAENTPQLHAIATRADAIPQLQAVWSRNFSDAGS